MRPNPKRRLLTAWGCEESWNTFKALERTCAIFAPINLAMAHPTQKFICVLSGPTSFAILISGTKSKNLMGFGKHFVPSVNAREVRFYFSPYFLFTFSQALGPFKRKELQYLYSSGLLPAYVFKKHFEFCCGTCRGDTIDAKVADWCRIWLDASVWVVDKWNKEWMVKYIDDRDSMVC